MSARDVLDGELDLSPELVEELGRMVAEPSEELLAFARKCARLLQEGDGEHRQALIALLAERLSIAERKAEELEQKLMTVGGAPRTIPRDTQWDKDRAAFQRLQPELKREYPGKFVAFDDGEVIAVGDTRREAAERAWERLGQAKSLMVRNVDEDIQAPRRVGVRLDRPRSIVGTR